jgi:hypothetical protein
LCLRNDSTSQIMYYNDISRAETSRKNIKLIAYRIVVISESATFSVVDY